MSQSGVMKKLLELYLGILPYYVYVLLDTVLVDSSNYIKISFIILVLFLHIGSAETSGDETVVVSYLIEATRGKGQYLLPLLGALVASKVLGLSFF